MSNEIEIQLSIPLIMELLKGKKVEHAYRTNDMITTRVTIYPPQEGLFITKKELHELLGQERDQIINKLLDTLATVKNE